MFLFCLVFAMFCACLYICALWSPAGKGLTSWLSFVVSTVSLSLSHWYLGSGVVLDLYRFLIFAPFITFVYKLKKIVGFNNFSAQFIKIISHFIKIGYTINVLQQTECLVDKPITAGNFVFLFNCTAVCNLRTSGSKKYDNIPWLV